MKITKKDIEKLIEEVYKEWSVEIGRFLEEGLTVEECLKVYSIKNRLIRQLKSKKIK